MNEPDSYPSYLGRWAGHGGRRKQLSPGEHAELSHEYERLLARMDPEDIQLDEWKRVEELRFLLVRPGDEDEDGE